MEKRKLTSHRAREQKGLVARDLAERLRNRFRDHPIYAFLDFEILDLDLDFCRMAISFLPRFDNGGGAIHGGVLSMLADTAVACALSTNFDGRMGFATSNLGIHFLRRARSRITASAHIIKKGAKVCVGYVEMHDADEKLIATSSCDFILTTSRLQEPQPEL
ncbi:MAG: PaaI family thioesterase [Thermoanaerobaculia bacterium]